MSREVCVHGIRIYDDGSSFCEECIKPMTPQTNEGLAQQPPCIMNHEEMYLHWCHQADGYSYFKCASCGWQKPDLELGTVGKIIKAKDTRIHSLEAEVERYKRIFSDVDVENPDAVNIMISAMKEHWEYIKSLKVALYDIKGLHTACGQCSISSDDRECLTFNLAKQALSRLKSGGGA